jgi:hypothetical protein
MNIYKKLYNRIKIDKGLIMAIPEKTPQGSFWIAADYGRPEHAIPFDQSEMIKKLDKDQHKELLSINERYGGLCDLICNLVIMTGLFDKPIGQLDNRGRPIKGQLSEYINAELLNQESVRNSHLLMISSTYEKAMAFLFKKFTNNIFSDDEQARLVSTSSEGSCINSKLFNEGLNRLAVGQVFKIEVFRRTPFGFCGHSLVAKREPDDFKRVRFSYFDPNAGMLKQVSSKNLRDLLNDQLEIWNANDVYITPAETLLERMTPEGGDVQSKSLANRAITHIQANFSGP